MYTFKDYFKPGSLEEAFSLLKKSPRNKIIAGNHFLSLTDFKINSLIDLNNLNLNYIKKDENYIHIGANCTLSQIEHSDILADLFHNSFSKTIGEIVSVQLRNSAQIGASVFSRFGFSDILPLLSALDAKVKLFKQNTLHIDEFLYSPKKRDILTEILIPNYKKDVIVKSIRVNKSSFPILNLALSKGPEGYKLCVGARPSRSKYLKEISESLNENGFRKPLVENLIEDDLFGSNYLGDKFYRTQLFLHLLERAYGEIND